MALSPSLLIEPNDVRAAAVAVVDTTGTQLSGFDSSRPTTATLTTVASSATSVSLLAANPARRRFVVVNESSKTLFIAFAATATLTAYTVSVAGGMVYEGVLNDYTGVVSGIWSTANGNARITEITS